MDVSRSVALLDVPFRVLGPTPLAPYRLAARLRAAGQAACVQDLRPLLVRKIGRGGYRELSENLEVGKFGEWLFATHARGERALAGDEAFLDRFAADLAPLRAVGDPRRWLRRLRAEVVPEFLADACARVEAGGAPAAVYCECTAFQTRAALALGRRLKQRHRQLRLVLGGPELRDAAGPALLDAAPWVDAVAQADEPLAPLLLALAAGRTPRDLPGVLVRAGRPSAASG